MSIPEDTIEEKYVKEMDLRSQAFLRKQYLPVKIVGLILVDLVPYEKKEEMIAGIKRLFTPEGDCQPAFSDGPRLNSLPDIRKSGIMTGGGDVNIGAVLNSDLGEGLLRGIQRNLPVEVKYIGVSIGQFVDFAYHVVYTCGLKDTVSSSIKKTFIESENWVPFDETDENGRKIKGRKPKGPKLEPVIQECQKKIEEYLKPFCSGIFLSQDSSSHCPSLKVYSTPSINFEKFENWKTFHLQLLDFLGIDFICSKFDNMIVSHYRESLIPTKPGSIFQGLVFLASEDKYQDKAYGNSSNQILSNLESLGWHGLSNILTLYYWSAYNLEIIQKNYEKTNTELMNRIKGLKGKTNNSIFEVQDNVHEAYNDFSNYNLTETTNLRVAKENSERFRLKRISRYSVPITKPEINLFHDLYEGSYRLIETENKKLKEIKDGFDSLFQYCINYVNRTLNETNMKLQQSMNLMTVVMVFLTVATVVLALSPYYSQIWDFFQFIWRLITSLFDRNLPFFTAF